jgi:cytochrome c5
MQEAERKITPTALEAEGGAELTFSPTMLGTCALCHTQPCEAHPHAAHAAAWHM